MKPQKLLFNPKILTKLANKKHYIVNLFLNIFKIKIEIAKSWSATTFTQINGAKFSPVIPDERSVESRKSHFGRNTHVRSDACFPAKLAVPAAGEPEELLGVELFVGVFGPHGAENVPSYGLVHQFRTESVT